MTSSFVRVKKHFQVTLLWLELGLLEQVLKLACMKEKWTFLRHVILPIARVLSKQLGASVKIIVAWETGANLIALVGSKSVEVGYYSSKGRSSIMKLVSQVLMQKGYPTIHGIRITDYSPDAGLNRAYDIGSTFGFSKDTFL